VRFDESATRLLVSSGGTFVNFFVRLVFLRRRDGTMLQPRSWIYEPRARSDTCAMNFADAPDSPRPRFSHRAQPTAYDNVRLTVGGQ